MGEAFRFAHVAHLHRAAGRFGRVLAAPATPSRQTVNAIENERYDPSLPLAFVIARVFVLPIEEIFSERRAGDGAQLAAE